jgi:enoyl-[acyl-carrier-protein] reductase (NADH)
MEGLTKYYAALYAKKNIRINNIRVGGVKNHQPDDFKNNFLKRTPNKKMLNKNDVAYLVDFLCSEKSKNIIGENINLEGGYNLW